MPAANTVRSPGILTAYRQQGSRTSPQSSPLPPFSPPSLPSKSPPTPPHPHPPLRDSIHPIKNLKRTPPKMALTVHVIPNGVHRRSQHPISSLMIPIVSNPQHGIIFSIKREIAPLHQPVAHKVDVVEDILVGAAQEVEEGRFGDDGGGEGEEDVGGAAGAAPEDGVLVSGAGDGEGARREVAGGRGVSGGEDIGQVVRSRTEDA